MRIFAKKSFQFDHPTNSADPVKVQFENFADIPDWVADSTMFKLASLDGDVLEIESKADEIVAEKGGKVKASKAADGAEQQ